MGTAIKISGELRYRDRRALLRALGKRMASGCEPFVVPDAPKSGCALHIAAEGSAPLSIWNDTCSYLATLAKTATGGFVELENGQGEGRRVVPGGGTRPLGHAPDPRRHAESVAASADGSWIAVGSAGHAILWQLDDPGGDPTMLYLHRGSVRSCTFSPDGRWFATGSSRGELRLWDLASASSVWRTKAHAVVHRVRFSADGERLVTCGYQGGVRLWSRDSGALVGELGESTKHTDCIDLSADGQRLLALRGERMTVFDLGRGQSYVREPRPDAALFGGYGDEIYLLGYCFERFEYRQSVIDAETGQLRREWPNAARCQAFDSEHRRLVSAGLGNTLRLWDSESGALLAQGEGLCELLEVFVVGRFVVGLSPIGGLHFFSLERLESVDPELPWLGQGA